MKKRVITALIAAAVFIGLLCTMFTPAFVILLILMSCISVYEITVTVGIKNRVMAVLSIVFAFAVPVAAEFLDGSMFPDNPVYAFLSANKTAFAVLYVIVMLMLMLLDYKETKFPESAVLIFLSVAIPAAYCLLLPFRDAAEVFPALASTKAEGVFLILFAMFSSWMSDIFALFTGIKFGKHKLAPEISPKKTVEGMIGGVVGALVMNVILCAVFRRFFIPEGAGIVSSYAFVVPASVVLSLVSVGGDLTASTIKRFYGVKDFGKLLPGHGGVLDRFDSCLFVFPVMYAALYIMNYCFAQ